MIVALVESLASKETSSTLFIPFETPASITLIIINEYVRSSLVHKFSSDREGLTHLESLEDLIVLTVGLIPDTVVLFIDCETAGGNLILGNTEGQDGCDGFVHSVSTLL